MAATSSHVLIGQLTDTHVIASADEGEHYVDNNARLATAVSTMNAESPSLDAVLVTGDLTDASHPDAYGTLARELAKLDTMVLPLPGNHDLPEAVRTTFPDVEWVDAAHASWVHVVGGVRVIGLDSTRPCFDGAEFDDARADFLAATLASSHDGPTILAMHHPPFVTGIAWMDRSGFVELDRFTDVLLQHPGSVDKIVCGHLHRPITSSVAGVPAQVGISTVQHVALELDPTASHALILDPVGYQIHLVAGDNIVTHTRYIDTGERPFTPDWAPDGDPTLAS